MRRLTFLVPLLALTLPGPLALAAPEALPWELVECTYAFARLPVHVDALGERMVDGMSPLWPVAPGPPVGSPLAMLTVEFNVCESGTTLDGVSTPATFAVIYLPVRAGPHTISGVGVHYLAWDVLVPEDAQRAALQDAGIPARDGRGTIVSKTGTVPGVDVAFTMDGLGDFRMDITGTPQPLSSYQNRVAFLHDTGGNHLAAWVADIDYASQNAVGTIELPAGSWIADVAGDTSVEARFFIGTQTYSRGSIRL